MLKYFLLGVIAVYVIIPIIDSLLSIITALLELIKYLILAKIAQIEDSLTDPVEESRPIGFLANIETEVGGSDSDA